MSVFVIWIDREHAKLFQFSEEKMERKNLEAQHVDHHTHRVDGIDVQQREKAFYSQLLEHLTDATRILILGPGVAKHHFQTYLMEHFPLVAKKIAGCETVDHPTDSQIAALARKFFSATNSSSTR